MNVRFATDGIRFRVSEEEAQQLLHSGFLEMNCSLPGDRSFRFSVKVMDDAGASLQVESSTAGLGLCVSRQGLISILNANHPKDLEIEQELAVFDGAGVHLSFEIDRFSLKGGRGRQVHSSL